MKTLHNGYENIRGCTRRQPNAVRIKCERHAVTRGTRLVIWAGGWCHGSDFALTPPPATPVMFNTWRLSAGQVQSSSITLIQSRQLRSPRSPHHHRCASSYHSSHHIHLYRSLCRCSVPSSYPLHHSSFNLPYV
jgi:hypothetical protein